ncbi:MAG: trimethylamine methyltransferase family protein [Deltaproteobacteria bacterium]|nr:trimethylamine methyltransferase family protein [Deltaproteobacteria bacterium]
MRRRLRSGISASSGLGLSSFSRDELDSIHYATLQILQDTGIKVMGEEALEVFHGGGARVERHDGFGIVKIPPYLVEDSAFFAPHTMVYEGRNPDDDFVVEPNRVGFATFGGCINIVDPYTRAIRRATKKDCGELIKVCDALEEISVATRSLNATDVMERAQSVHNLDAMVRNTGKHLFLGVDSARSLEVMVELASAAVGGRDLFDKRPIFSASVCPISPLTLGKSACEVILACARLGIGMVVLPMALSGGTSSASLAGTLVTHNAEVLGTIVLAQLVNRGLTCTYGSTSAILDLRFGTSAIGSPEYGMINASLAKVAQYYRLPSWVGGGASDSKEPDIQSGYEFCLSATLSALSGANIVFGSGVLEQGMTMDYAKLLLDAEMLGMIQIAQGGVAVNDVTLSMDVIHEVGPGGAYITHEHSLRSMRSQSRSRLFDRRSRADWLEITQGKSIIERAYERAVDILENHEPHPLPEGASETMQEIVDAYEEELSMDGKR